MFTRLLPLVFIASFSINACAAPTKAPNATPNAAVSPPNPALPAPISQAPVLQAQASTAVQTPAAQLTQSQRFERWKKDFMAEALAKGYDIKLVSPLIAPAKINKLALDRDSKQPEFSRQIWAYVDGAVSADRLNKGKGKLAAHKADFNKVTALYPVDRNILTAIWGLESSYGRIQGDHNIVDALATFAF